MRVSLASTGLGSHFADRAYFQRALSTCALRAARVTMDEVLAVLRASGCAGLEDVEALVLESDGSLSLVPRAKGPSPQVLKGVRRPAGEAPPDAERGAPSQ